VAEATQPTIFTIGFEVGRGKKQVFFDGLWVRGDGRISMVIGPLAGLKRS
jgi:hypothetical protein